MVHVLKIVPLIATAQLLMAQGIGFPVTVTEDDIEWQYPVLSKEGCPDVSGIYLNVGRSVYRDSRAIGLAVLLTGGVTLPIKGATFKLFKDIPRNPDGSSSVVTFGVVRYEANDIAIMLVDGHGNRYALGQLAVEGHRVGCYGDTLVVRDLRRHVNFEARMQLVTHSETALRKAADGSLVAVRTSGSRERQLSIGHKFRPLDSRVESWKFERVNGEGPP